MARLEKVGWELSNIDEFLEIEKRVRQICPWGGKPGIQGVFSKQFFRISDPYLKGGPLGTLVLCEGSHPFGLGDPISLMMERTLNLFMAQRFGVEACLRDASFEESVAGWGTMAVT